MEFKSVEQKWQSRWEKDKLYNFKPNSKKPKYYVLEMFSYPSGAKLHAGHWFNYGPSDSFARFKLMQGYNVFEPMGFDAFGLPAENYAIKTGVHPEDSTLKNIETMEHQLRVMGAMFDWDAEVVTCLPDYYKWTQWLFLQLYKHGLAYRKEAPVNWCSSCNTVLANEQVIDGACERCGTTVVKKNLTQWFFKITNYAEELLTSLDKLDWPEKTKLMQKNWIGKSTGGEIEFSLTTGETFRVFTTRADTLFGVSYVVLAPEHPLVDKIATPEQKTAVAEYKKYASTATEIDRLSSTREKTGVWTGAYAINPINNQKIPVWTADYVLFSYGTGAVMGVPAHDERDFAFAQKYDLPITRVIEGIDCDDTLPFVEYTGKMTASGEFNGLTVEEGKTAVIKALEKQGKGELKTNYRLRDWLVSRQRYWGAPIPVIHCEHCGAVPVPEKDLPVLLPYDVDFTPDGKSPLLKHDGFMHTTCPICGRPALRDADTLDTFVCSSWYYLRYVDNKNADTAFDKAKIDKMLPVDKYIGGAEHACLHLLYARFATKALRDMGYLDFDEPFTSLVHQGLILGPDGYKMSKSRGNVISPDTFINQYGSDAFRMYLMFGFSYKEGGAWSDDGIRAVSKYMERVERLCEKAYNITDSVSELSAEDKELNFIRNTTIERVTADMEAFSFNTAIARLMELTNALGKYSGGNDGLFRATIIDLIKLLAPITPHFAEELNEKLGRAYSIFNDSYPVVDKKATVRDTVEIAIQVNSKVRAKSNINADSTEDEIKSAALASLDIAPFIAGKNVKKVIVIKGRLVNIVTD